MESIAKKIDDMRKRWGMTIEDVCQMSNVTTRTYYNFLKRPGTIKLSTVAAFAAAVGVALDIRRAKRCA